MQLHDSHWLNTSTSHAISPTSRIRPSNSIGNSLQDLLWQKAFHRERDVYANVCSSYWSNLLIFSSIELILPTHQWPQIFSHLAFKYAAFPLIRPSNSKVTNGMIRQTESSIGGEGEGIVTLCDRLQGSGNDFPRSTFREPQIQPFQKSDGNSKLKTSSSSSNMPSLLEMGSERTPNHDPKLALPRIC